MIPPGFTLGVHLICQQVLDCPFRSTTVLGKARLYSVTRQLRPLMERDSSRLQFTQLKVRVFDTTFVMWCSCRAFISQLLFSKLLARREKGLAFRRIRRPTFILASTICLTRFTFPRGLSETASSPRCPLFLT